MYTLIIFIHVIVSVLLIIVVLLQSGKGGGLVESFSSAESIFGTKTPAFMARLTTVLVVLFFATTLSLAFLSTQKTKSLVESKGLVEEKTQEATLPKATQPAVQGQSSKVEQPENNPAKIPTTAGDSQVPQK